MYLFPALSETHVVGKNEKAVRFRPNISVYTLCDLGRSCNLSESVFSSVKWEWHRHHRAAMKGKWVSIPESVHIFKSYKNVKYLCSREGIWNDGHGHWVMKMRQQRRECTMAALRGNGKHLNGHPHYHRYVFLCMKIGIHYKSSIMSIVDFKLLGSQCVNSRPFWWK